MRLNKDAIARYYKLDLERLINIDDYARLYRLAKKLHRCFEIDCNGTDRDKSKYETWEEYDIYRDNILSSNELLQGRIYSKIDKICKANNLNYYIQSDPRGGTLFVCDSNTEINQGNYNAVGIYIK